MPYTAKERSSKRPSSRPPVIRRPLQEVAIKAISGQGAAEPARAAAMGGISARHVPLPPGQSFSYAWEGRSHYLALHDIRLRDGELFSDGSSPIRLRDLRSTLTFMPAQCRVWGWSQPTMRAHSFTAIYFDPQKIDDEIAERFSASSLVPSIYFSHPSLQANLEKLSAALKAPLPPDKLYIESLCVLSALEVCRFQQHLRRPALRTPGQITPSQYRKICEYVDANLASDIGLSELAATVELSRFHLIRAFKKTTGKTPYQYLLHRRIERAHALLEQGRTTVEKVAREVGFKGTSRFIRTFRQLRGMTPGAFAAERVDSRMAEKLHDRR